VDPRAVVDAVAKRKIINEKEKKHCYEIQSKNVIGGACSTNRYSKNYRNF
jgi:hypothetical protein